MKKSLLLIIGLVLLMNLFACESKQTDDSRNNTSEPKQTDDSTKTSEPITTNNNVKITSGNESPEPTINRTSEIKNVFDVGNIEVIDELEGKEFVKQTRSVTKEEHQELIKKPRGYAKLWFEDKCGALIPSSENILLEHSLFDIWFPYLKVWESSSSTNEMSYYELPDILSTDLKISGIGDRIENLFVDLDEQRKAGNMVDKGIIIDDKNNILISFIIDRQKLKIVKAIKTKSDIYPLELRVIFGYNEDGVFKALLTDNANNIYIFKADSLELISQKNMEDWKVLSGYHVKVSYDERYYDNGNNKEIYCLYLYNEKENRLMKYDLFKDNIVYDLDISRTPVKGKVIKVATNGDLLIYFLTEDNGKYSIYQTNEERWHIFSKSDKFVDDSGYENIDDIWWFKANSAHDYIAIYNSKADDPVKLSKATFPGEVK